ncbi:MAG: type II and III secretion system protein family protein [Amphiplicatus sp.]
MEKRNAGVSTRSILKALVGAAALAAAPGAAFAEGPTKLSAPAGDASLSAPATATATSSPMRIAAPNGDYAGGVEEIPVILNKSRIVSTDRRFREVAVGNSEIADVVPLARDRFYVLGKKIGSTNVILTDQGGNVIAVYDVAVGYDADGLKRKIHEVAPGTDIEVRSAGDSLLLSGSAADGGKAGAVAALAERYAPGRVTNMVGVLGSQQVMLHVRFAEVQRSALKDLGVNSSLLKLDDNGTDAFFSAIGDGVKPQTFVAGGALFSGSSYALDVLVDALEQKGLVRTLAEPNIISLSGDTASFLAGGEFPIPVAQSSNAGQDGGFAAITVEFKEFGVGLSFTPTVLGKDTINLEMNSEVSSIDPSITVTIGSITIPGLKVRRTNNTVELLDGQSFAIAGLIQDDLTQAARQAPWIGSLPIIGALARSTNFERRQTELVVIITARLVKPVKRDELAAPTDFILPPSEFDHFMLGRTERLSAAAEAGGIDGNYGYAQP